MIEILKPWVEGLLQCLEWLAKYGFIDIVFGLGIGGFIVAHFRKRPVSEIDGVEIAVQFLHTNDPNIIYKSKLYFTIENHSGQPLYIYRVLFSSTPATKQGPKLSPGIRKNITGWYLPTVEAQAPGGKGELPQIVPTGGKCTMFIPLDSSYNKPEAQQELEHMREEKAIGVLMMFCMCGERQLVLKSNVQ